MFSIQLGRDLRFLNGEVMSSQIDRVKGKASALKAGPFLVWQAPYILQDPRVKIGNDVFA